MRPQAVPSLSHWIDETLPEQLRDLLIRNGLDADAFAARIAPAVGAYRSAMHVRENLPERSKEADHARRLSALLADLNAYLKPGAMPARLHARLGAVLLTRAGENSNELRARIASDALLMQAGLCIVERELRAHHAPRGRKPETARAGLLAAIVDEIHRQIGGTLKKSRIIAIEALEALGIDSLSSEQDSPHKAASRATKRRVQK